MALSHDTAFQRDNSASRAFQDAPSCFARGRASPFFSILLGIRASLCPGSIWAGAWLEIHDAAREQARSRLRPSDSAASDSPNRRGVATAAPHGGLPPSLNRNRCKPVLQKGSGARCLGRRSLAAWPSRPGGAFDDAGRRRSDFDTIGHMLNLDYQAVALRPETIEFGRIGHQGRGFRQGLFHSRAI